MMAPRTCSDILLLFFIKVFFTNVTQHNSKAVSQVNNKLFVTPTNQLLINIFPEHQLNSRRFPVFPGVADTRKTRFKAAE